MSRGGGLGGGGTGEEGGARISDIFYEESEPKIKKIVFGRRGGAVGG